MLCLVICTFQVRISDKNNSIEDKINTKKTFNTHKQSIKYIIRRLRHSPYANIILKFIHKMSMEAECNGTYKTERIKKYTSYETAGAR